MNNVLRRFVATFLSATLGLMLVLANIAPAQATVNLEQGLVAHYPFNGNANDESGNSHNGTVNGATLTEDRFGKAKSAYSFDGKDDYIAANSVTTGLTLPFAVSGWFNARDLKDSALFGFNNINDRDENRNLLFWSKKKIYHYNKNNGQVLSKDTFEKNEWHHLVWQVDINRKGSLFIDGLEQATWSNSDNRAANRFSIGQEFDGSTKSDFFNGSIDDVRLYNRVLSATEVQALYKDTDNNTQAEVEIRAGNLTITAPKTVDFGNASVSKTKQTLEVTLTDPNYFTVEDLKGAKAGYYTTISVTDLTDGNKKVIAAENLSVQVPKGKVHKLAGYADANVVVPKDTQSYLPFL